MALAKKEEQSADIATVGHEVGHVDVNIGPRFLNLFSEHLYSSPNRAFEELVSNSWDAGAEAVYIGVPDKLDTPSAAVWVLDDGQSMDIDGLQALWSVATSNKRASETLNGRKQIGKFGVGKLATYVLANQLTHICKASDGKIRIVTMDYRVIDKAVNASALHIDKIPLKVRELQQTELEGFLSQTPSGQAVLNIINAGIPKANTATDSENEYGAVDAAPPLRKGTWTVAILSALKKDGQSLQQGWIRRILRASLPLGTTISVKFNNEVLVSTKSSIDAQQEWVLGPDVGFDTLTLDDETTVPVVGKAEPYPHIEIPGLGVVTGRARLYKSKISGGKSDQIESSNGFFVNVRGRVIKPEDPNFGLENLSHSAWAKFRTTIRADGLDEKLVVTRESISESRELRIVQALLMRLFNRARTAHDGAIFSGWPNAGEVLVEKWGTVPFEPLRRAIGERLDGRLPAFVDASKVTDISRVRDEWAKAPPADIITDVSVEDGPKEARLVKYDLDSRKVVVNKNHPFAREHGTSLEQLNLLRDAALVELLTEAFMVDIGIPDERIKEISDYRERAYRLVAQVGRRSAAQIASLLLEATDHDKGLERIVGDALEYIGFNVERYGQSGQPEGVATAPITAAKGDTSDRPRIYKFTYDAKSSKTGKVKTSNIGIAGLVRHRKDYDAQHTLVVAPDYADGALQEEATEHKITPMRAKDLAALMMLTVGYGPLDLADFESIFNLYDPDQVANWVQQREAKMKQVVHLSLDTLIQALVEITKANPDRPDTLDCSLIAEQCRKILSHKTFPSKATVAQTIRGLALIVPNVISISETGFDVMLSAAPTKIKEALAQQLNKVPAGMKYGITQGI